MKRKLVPCLLLIPFLLVSAILLWGLADGVLQGLGYIPAFGMNRLSLEYFKDALTGSGFWRSLGISLYIAAISATISIILAVPLAFALSELKKTRAVLYAIIKIPMFIPWMVTGLLTMSLLGKSGWLARVFHAAGIDNAADALSNILFRPHQFGVILAFIWACTPFACFFILNVMDNISQTLSEAATTLGASRLKRFFYVTLPLCRNSIRNVFVILLLSCFGNYELPMLLGMTTPRALPVEIYYQYNHYDLRHRPYAMALNSLMLLFSLTLAGAALTILTRHKGAKSQNPERNHEN